MTYYSVLDVTPTNEDWIPDYIGPANKLVAEHGGKYLARTASHERLETVRLATRWPRTRPVRSSPTPIPAC